CGTTAGLDRNCDGFPNDSKIAIARDAIRKMISGVGDVEWSLSKFRQTHGTNVRCLTYDGSSDCQYQSYGNPQCNTGTSDNSGCVGAVSTTCRPGSGSNIDMRRATGSDFNGCINYYSNGCLGADLLVGFTGYGAYTSFDNRPAILKWVDNVEGNFNADTTAGN